MPTGNEEYIIEKLDSMTIDEARKAIASGQFGSIGRPDRAFASELLSAKEAEERDGREAETLSISRKALDSSTEATSVAREANSIASKALRNSKWANIIAIAAIAIAIIIAWLTKN